jgi:hypothetical protein
MERRELACGLAALPLVLLASCSAEEDKVLDVCADRDRDTRSYIERISEGLEKIENNLGDFNDSGWRDASSVMRSSVGDLRTVVEEMKQELDS